MSKNINGLTNALIWFVVFFTALSIYVFYPQTETVLPVYNPADINPLLVDNSLIAKRTNHQVSDFSLINQNGERITHETYDGKIYVADFFFTKCPSICPVMTNNMLKIQEAFIEDEDVMILSLSVTPNIDSVEVLKAYALNKGVNDDKWHLTTGDKNHIYKLARQSYFAVTEESQSGAQDFIHTPNFVLIDKEKQIRGIYDGTKKQEIDRIINDIIKLKG